MPLWDVELAAAEVRRNAARGVRAVAFSEIPAYLGLPSIHSGYWEPFFATCAETGTVVCMHIGSGTKTPHTSDDSPDAVDAARDLPPVQTAVLEPRDASGGFDWGDAGIGAAGMLAIFSIAAGSALLLTGRKRRHGIA